jgi:hypothetical protein
MSEKSFIAEWRKQLVTGQIGVVLVEADHPLEVYVGASDLGHPLVQIRSKAKPKLPEISELVLVDRKEGDGRWVLSLSLQDSRFAEVYMRLVAHLVAASRRCASPAEAWATVDGILDEWRRLLRFRPVGVLSLDELRGLVGELWLVLNRFAPTSSVEQAVMGWLGPLGAPQDFWYEASGFHEAKAIGPTATRVKISSAHQLDESDMELLVLQVPQVVDTEPGAVSLVTLVSKVVAVPDNAASVSAELDLRMKRLGVDLNHPYYSETWFRVAAVETFTVSEEFPAIRQSLLSVGVDRVRYSLDRAAIAPFLTSTENL